MKHVDIDDPLTLLAHAYLGCIQRECKPNETIIEQFTKIFVNMYTPNVPLCRL